MNPRSSASFGKIMTSSMIPTENTMANLATQSKLFQNFIRAPGRLCFLGRLRSKISRCPEVFILPTRLSHNILKVKVSKIRPSLGVFLCYIVLSILFRSSISNSIAKELNCANVCLLSSETKRSRLWSKSDTPLFL